MKHAIAFRTMRSGPVRSVVAALALMITLTAAGGAADAKQVRYVGVHPLPGRGKALCYIDAPHVHVFAPARAEILYRKHGDAHVFVGDPVAHGYDGKPYAYYGHHPIDVDVLFEVEPPADEICYLDGPHYHSWAPGEGAPFTLAGGAYWYVGAYPPEYRVELPTLVAINAYYRPIAYDRPVVEVDPPAGYVGPVVEARAAVRADVPAVEVVAPAVEVVAPAVRAGIEVRVPTIEVGIGVGAGVSIGGGVGEGRRRGHPGRARGHRKGRD